MTTIPPMTTLLDLIDVDMPGRPTPAEKFEAFHKANPQVFTILSNMCDAMVEKGRRRIGIATLFESMRWSFYLTTNDPDSEFKLNNNYRAYYARKLMQIPRFEGLFELREQRNA